MLQYRYLKQMAGQGVGQYAALCLM